MRLLSEFAKSRKPAVYANCIVERHGPAGPELICDLCRKPGTARWRCDSCVRERDLCTSCLRSRHMANPYHRVRYLTGTQYKEAWLRDAGVFIQLCPVARGTAMCPSYALNKHKLPPKFDEEAPPTYGSIGDAGIPRGTSTAGTAPAGPPSPSSSEDTLIEEDPDDPVWRQATRAVDLDEGDEELRVQDDDEQTDDEGGAGEGGPGAGIARDRGRQARIKKDHWGFRAMVIVDQADVHELGVAYCGCRAGGLNMDRDEQLIKLGGLFPASQKNPRTCFTVRGLEYHQVDRLECKSAPQAIMRKVKRFTSPLHPTTVPVRSSLPFCGHRLTFDRIVIPKCFESYASTP